MSESNLQFDLSKLNFNPMKTRKNSKEKNEKSTAVTNKINEQDNQINTNKQNIEKIPTINKISLGIQNNNLAEINEKLEEELIKKREEIQKLKKNQKYH